MTWNVQKAMHNRLPELQTALEKINLTEQPLLVALQETGCSEKDLKGKLNMQGMQYAAYSTDCTPSANAGTAWLIPKNLVKHVVLVEKHGE